MTPEEEGEEEEADPISSPKPLSEEVPPANPSEAEKPAEGVLPDSSQEKVEDMVTDLAV